MYNKKILMGLKKLISEEKIPGLDTTKKVNKEAKKFHKDYKDEVEAKMKAYEEDTIKGEVETVNKINATDEQKKHHDQMEIRNGQEMLKYDLEPSKRFKERATMAIKGDRKMGNEVKTGKWNPETGEGNGNTESTWGASDDKFGEKLHNTAKAAHKQRNEATPSILQFGNDIELRNDTKTLGASRNHAFEGEVKSKKVIKEKMKRLVYKKEFNGLETAVKVIPESYKVDNKEFEMTDGNETYHIRWEGTLTEGEAIVLSENNKNMVNEESEKMKKLFNFNSRETLGSLKGKERMNENIKFNDIYNKSRKLIKGGE